MPGYRTQDPKAENRRLGFRRLRRPGSEDHPSRWYGVLVRKAKDGKANRRKVRSRRVQAESHPGEAPTGFPEDRVEGGTQVTTKRIDQSPFDQTNPQVGQKGRVSRFACPCGLSLMDLQPKFEKGGRWRHKSKLCRLPDYFEHGRQILLESSVRILGEPLRRQTLGRNSCRRRSLDLGFDFENEVGEGGQAGDSVFERETRPHRKNAKVNLLKVKTREGIGHKGESKRDRAVLARNGCPAYG